MSREQLPPFFYEIFDASLPRHGPGDDESTRKALTDLLSARPEWTDASAMRDLRILDLGCGAGPQTIQLAKLTGARIVAVDNHQRFLDEMMRRADAAGVADLIEPRRQDMNKLDYEDASFDLIWSEGAIFVMGFRDGLATCHRLLVPGGLMALTELTWFNPEPPEECKRFFDEAYSPMTDIPTNLEYAKQAGFRVIDHFRLPESSWTDNYLGPLGKRLRLLRETYQGDADKADLMDLIQAEIDIYRKYSSSYGYVFYLLQSA